MFVTAQYLETDKNKLYHSLVSNLKDKMGLRMFKRMQNYVANNIRLVKFFGNVLRLRVKRRKLNYNRKLLLTKFKDRAHNDTGI